MTPNIPLPDLDKLAQALPYGTNPTGCAVPRCTNPHRALGLCNAHYSRLLRWRRANGITGRASRPPVTPAPAIWSRDHGDTCTVPGCSRPYSTRGLCRAHYEHARRHNAI